MNTPIHFNYKAYRFYRKFAAHLRSHLGKRLPKTIVIACSGGPDSVALVDLMHRFACENPVVPVIVHVNHKLRGAQSTRDEKFVKILCDQRKLAYVILEAKPSKSKNIQADARNLRYTALSGVARRVKSPVVLTAHHANDQAETVLLHLMRGSGPEALSGIHKSRQLAKGVTVLRPLLPFTRDEISVYIRNARLKFVTDSSNRSMKYTRNWIRKKVIPLLAEQNPKIVEALCLAAQKCSPS